MKPKNTANEPSLTTRPRTPAQDQGDALEAARTEAREARTQAAATRSWAEATNAQLRAMQALTDTALSHLALDDLLRELLGRVTAVMGVDAVGISLLDADGQTLTLRAARGLGEEDTGRVQIPVRQGFSGRIMASREPLIVDADALSGADFEGGDPILRERLRSVAGVPLLVEGPVGELGEGREVSWLIGVLVVGSTLPHRFTEADVQLLQRAADRIAMAINHTRLYAAEQDARQRAEAALARAQSSEAQATERAEELHTILETMADGVVVYDVDGGPTQMNQAYRALLALDHAPAGYEDRSLRERLKLLHLRDATGAPLLFENTPSQRALRGEVFTGPRADIRARAFDGRELEVNTSVAPLRDREGHLAGAVVVVHDRTERNRLERERAAARADELAAREASRRMEAFVATAAHDLRSPLTAVVGYIDLAKRQSERLAAAARETHPDLASQVEGVRDRVADAGQSAKRLTRLLTLLFDMAAIRADQLELHREPCDLATLVGEQVATLRVAAPERTIRLQLPVGGAPVPVEADADRIGQVVTNYVTNALKYSAADQPVDVRVAVHRRRARVAVCDRGPGLPKEEQARVWELFHRAPGVTAQSAAQGGSLGLGLHISRAIVTAHGGRVGLQSTVGQGSTFWFTLPLASAQSLSGGAAA
jgi:PAS domain S-box-containing protein